MNKIIKGIIIIIGFCAVFFLIGRIGWHETHVTKLGSIVAIEEKENGTIVTMKDSEGFLWEFFGEGYNLHDIVSADFWNNGTDLNQYDDELVNVKIITKA